jgi:hypothetical protein
MMDIGVVTKDAPDPIPNRNWPLFPQPHALPFLSIAIEIAVPAEISQKVFDAPTTETGVNLEVVVVSPNEPNELIPQAQALPFLSIASVYASPESILQNVFVAPAIDTGVFLSVIELSPTFPPELSPQPQTLPFFSIAIENVVPAVI